MAGRRRRKKGERHKSDCPKRRLHYLAEAHIGRDVRQAISDIEGCAVSTPTAYGLTGRPADRVLIETATRHKRIFLTWDNETIHEGLYPICTHAGILKLRLESMSPSHVIPRLVRFIRSEHFKKCHHAIVELFEAQARVLGRTGLEIVQY